MYENTYNEICENYIIYLLKFFLIHFLWKKNKSLFKIRNEILKSHHMLYYKYLCDKIRENSYVQFVIVSKLLMCKYLLVAILLSVLFNYLTFFNMSIMVLMQNCIKSV